MYEHMNNSHNLLSRYKTVLLLTLIIALVACKPKSEYKLDYKLLNSLGSKYRMAHEKAIRDLTDQLKQDSTNLEAWIAKGELEIILFAYGYTPRKETIPIAKECLKQAQQINPDNTKTLELSGMLHLLDWDWEPSRRDLRASIAADSTNLNARHWYSLWLVTQGRIEEALIQHDTIQGMDVNENYLIGRGSIYYFLRDNERLKDLMIYTADKDPGAPWAYDWLGMAYIEMNDYERSLDTYFKAFELSDGLVEIGAGLGHALGEAGETKLAGEMADFYEEKAKTAYLPQMQRAFIHISIGENDKAIALLQEAYKQKSWFLTFMAVEPWLDPLRDDPRFRELKAMMKYTQ